MLLRRQWRRRQSAPCGEKRPFQAQVITETYLDRQGFLWNGTREGLFLHDGQRFVNFHHDADAPDSISDSGVRGVFEDSRGRLWIYTLNFGLNLLDRVRTGAFVKRGCRRDSTRGCPSWCRK